MASKQMVVNLTWTGATGSPGTNTWHFRTTGAFADTGEVEGLSGIVQDFYTALQGYFPSSLNIQMFGDITGVLTDEGSIQQITSWGLAGSGGTDYLPPATCGVASWRAATGGRSGRGRTFLGPLSGEASGTNGAPSIAFAADLQAAIDDLVDASTGFGDGAVAILSRTDSLLRDIVIGQASAKFGSLRSRRD